MEKETSDVQRKCQGPLQLLSPPFLVTSTTKQMRPNGRGDVIRANMSWVLWTQIIHCGLCWRVNPKCDCDLNHDFHRFSDSTCAIKIQFEPVKLDLQFDLRNI